MKSEKIASFTSLLLTLAIIFIPFIVRMFVPFTWDEMTISLTAIYTATALAMAGIIYYAIWLFIFDLVD